MKIKLLLVAFALCTVLAFTGCVSTEAGSPATASTATASSTPANTGRAISLKLYDNCPSNTYALAAELALKATIPGYNGITTVTVKGTPTVNDALAAVKYYGYCESIRLAMEKGTGVKKTLSFNTKSDGTGTKLNFSNTNNALETLLTMLVTNSTTVYAIYK